MNGPRMYRSLQEFTREEIGKRKLGWSLDDLYAEADITPKTRERDDDEVQELNFDF